MTIRRKLSVALGLAMGATLFMAVMLSLSLRRLEAIRARARGAHHQLDALKRLESAVSRQVVDTLVGDERALPRGKLQVRAALEQLKAATAEERELWFAGEKEEEEELLALLPQIEAAAFRLGDQLELLNRLRRTGYGEAIQHHQAAVDRLYKIEFLGAVEYAIESEAEEVAWVEAKAARLSRAMHRVGVAFSLLLGLLVLALATRIFRAISRSLEVLQQGAARVGRGDLETKLLVPGDDELAELGRAFNRMISDLREKTVSRDYLDNIVQSMTESLLVLNPHGTIRTCNSAACELFDYSSEELLGRSVDSIFEKEAVELVNLLRDSSAARISEVTGKARNGRRIPVIFSGSTMRGDTGTVKAIVCVARDISDRKKAEEDLRRAHDELETRVRVRTEELTNANTKLDRFRAILDATSDFVAIAASDKSLLYLNKSGREMVGLPLDADISGRQVREFHPPHTNRMLEDKVFPSLSRHGSWTGEASFLAGNEREIPVSMVALAKEGADNQVEFFATVSRDITEERRAAKQLAAVNKELESFAYSVSHDLRQPLRTIDGFSKAVLEDYGTELDPKGRHYLARIRAGAQQMGQLIDGLLGLSRVTRGAINRTDVDLAELATLVVAELRAADPSRQVDFVIPKTLVAFGDRSLLHAVVANLIGNAWKFSSKRSRARIEVGTHNSDQITAFFVKDNGVGFDMAYSDKLFASFQRLHSSNEFEGTGIGLATVHRIIQRHGGRIWAESEVDGGATFYFTLA